MYAPVLRGLKMRCLAAFTAVVALAGLFTASNSLAQTIAPAAPPPVSASPGLSTYKLAPGDIISIKVFGEDEFTREKIRLNDAGSVSFPLLGEIPVLGQTVGDIEKMVDARLRGRILVNPRVSVWIEEYRPFYINGMVERPGAYPYQPGLNVRKAVSIAGGFKERASQEKIFITREGESNAKPKKVPVTAEVGPGDAITVEESFF
jgi:polysaccharide export outer membrane protein